MSGGGAAAAAASYATRLYALTEREADVLLAVLNHGDAKRARHCELARELEHGGPVALADYRLLGSGAYGRVYSVVGSTAAGGGGGASPVVAYDDRFADTVRAALKVIDARTDEQEDEAHHEARVMFYLYERTHELGRRGELTPERLFAFPAIYAHWYCTLDPDAEDPDAVIVQRNFLLIELMHGMRAYEFARRFTRRRERSASAPLPWPRHQRRPHVWHWLLRALAAPAYALDAQSVLHGDLGARNCMVTTLAMVHGRGAIDADAVLADVFDDDNGARVLERTFARARRLHDDAKTTEEELAAEVYAQAVPLVRIYDFGFAETCNYRLIERAEPTSTVVTVEGRPTVVRSLVAIDGRPTVPPSRLEDVRGWNLAFFLQWSLADGLLPTRLGQRVALLFDSAALDYYVWRRLRSVARFALAARYSLRGTSLREARTNSRFPSNTTAIVPPPYRQGGYVGRGEANARSSSGVYFRFNVGEDGDYDDARDEDRGFGVDVELTEARTWPSTCFAEQREIRNLLPLSDEGRAVLSPTHGGGEQRFVQWLRDVHGDADGDGGDRAELRWRQRMASGVVPRSDPRAAAVFKWLDKNTAALAGGHFVVREDARRVDGDFYFEYDGMRCAQARYTELAQRVAAYDPKFDRWLVSAPLPPEDEDEDDYDSDSSSSSLESLSSVASSTDEEVHEEEQAPLPPPATQVLEPPSASVTTHPFTNKRPRIYE
jgi:hypothetical protein